MGTAKALLDYRGETFLDRLIRIFGETCNSVTVVLGHDRSIEYRISRGNHAKFVTNPDYEKGQLTSLQCGLRAIPADAEAVIFTPVDYPAIQASTVRKMIAASGRSRLVIPRWDGRRGHPVLFAASVIGEFLDLPAEAEARTVVRRNAADTEYVDVEDPGILRDVDDPRAYAELLEAAPPVE
jgi:molybdenum cofactor cytidylyltransferase